ncbi:STAS domain-containing protein [Streptomyces sp. NPDC051921]|uniref:STAS domain-containing protein n=1 Tax=Streptomyces sp. NPDC051921 TaxID=3155806 RepID=UPI00343F546B
MLSHFDDQPATPPDDAGGVPDRPTVAVVFESGPQRVLARVSGEIDLDSARSLREDLFTAFRTSPTGLVVDLAAVTFCDSSGLHILLDLHWLAAKTGKSLVLTVLSRPVARLLDITGTRPMFTLHSESRPGAPPDLTPIPRQT